MNRADCFGGNLAGAGVPSQAVVLSGLIADIALPSKLLKGSRTVPRFNGNVH
jgi:hypothetical protein